MKYLSIPFLWLMMSFIISHVKVPIIQIFFPLYGKWVVLLWGPSTSFSLSTGWNFYYMFWCMFILVWTIRNLISLLKLEACMFYQIWCIFQASFIQFLVYLNKLQGDFTILLNFLFFSLYWSDCIFSLILSSSSINSPDHFILHCIPPIIF